jgi:hypothetical protein
VTPVNDGNDEADETVVLTLAGGTGYSVGSPATATVTISDNDGPGNPPVTNPPGDRPGDKDEYKKGGWKSFGVFKNQGDCVSWFATEGKNPPAG